VTFLSLDMRDKTYTTGIVFIIWIVQTLGFHHSSPQNGRAIGPGIGIRPTSSFRE